MREQIRVGLFLLLLVLLSFSALAVWNDLLNLPDTLDVSRAGQRDAYTYTITFPEDFTIATTETGAGVKAASRGNVLVFETTATTYQEKSFGVFRGYYKAVKIGVTNGAGVTTTANIHVPRRASKIFFELLDGNKRSYPLESVGPQESQSLGTITQTQTINDEILAAAEKNKNIPGADILSLASYKYLPGERGWCIEGATPTSTYQKTVFTVQISASPVSGITIPAGYHSPPTGECAQKVIFTQEGKTLTFYPLWANEGFDENFYFLEATSGLIAEIPAKDSPFTETMGQIYQLIRNDASFKIIKTGETYVLKGTCGECDSLELVLELTGDHFISEGLNFTMGLPVSSYIGSGTDGNPAVIADPHQLLFIHQPSSKNFPEINFVSRNFAFEEEKTTKTSVQKADADVVNAAALTAFKEATTQSTTSQKTQIGATWQASIESAKTCKRNEECTFAFKIKMNDGADKANLPPICLVGVSEPGTFTTLYGKVEESDKQPLRFLFPCEKAFGDGLSIDLTINEDKRAARIYFTPIMTEELRYRASKEKALSEEIQTFLGHIYEKKVDTLEVRPIGTKLYSKSSSGEYTSKTGGAASRAVFGAVASGGSGVAGSGSGSGTESQHTTVSFPGTRDDVDRRCGAFVVGGAAAEGWSVAVGGAAGVKLDCVAYFAERAAYYAREGVSDASIWSGEQLIAFGEWVDPDGDTLYDTTKLDADDEFNVPAALREIQNLKAEIVKLQEAEKTNADADAQDAKDAIQVRAKNIETSAKAARTNVGVRDSPSCSKVTSNAQNHDKWDYYWCLKETAEYILNVDDISQINTDLLPTYVEFSALQDGDSNYQSKITNYQDNILSAIGSDREIDKTAIKNVAQHLRDSARGLIWTMSTDKKFLYEGGEIPHVALVVTDTPSLSLSGTRDDPTLGLASPSEGTSVLTITWGKNNKLVSEKKWDLKVKKNGEFEFTGVVKSYHVEMPLQDGGRSNSVAGQIIILNGNSGDSVTLKRDDFPVALINKGSDGGYVPLTISAGTVTTLTLPLLRGLNQYVGGPDADLRNSHPFTIVSQPSPSSYAVWPVYYMIEDNDVKRIHGLAYTIPPPSKDATFSFLSTYGNPKSIADQNDFFIDYRKDESKHWQVFYTSKSTSNKEDYEFVSYDQNLDWEGNFRIQFATSKVFDLDPHKTITGNQPVLLIDVNDYDLYGRNDDYEIVSGNVITITGNAALDTDSATETQSGKLLVTEKPYCAGDRGQVYLAGLVANQKAATKAELVEALAAGALTEVAIRPLGDGYYGIVAADGDVSLVTLPGTSYYAEDGTVLMLGCQEGRDCAEDEAIMSLLFSTPRGNEYDRLKHVGNLLGEESLYLAQVIGTYGG